MEGREWKKKRVEGSKLGQCNCNYFTESEGLKFPFVVFVGFYIP